MKFSPIPEKYFIPIQNYFNWLVLETKKRWHGIAASTLDYLLEDLGSIPTWGVYYQ
jgi:hypothetical protein